MRILRERKVEKTSARAKSRRVPNQVGVIISADMHDATIVGMYNERYASVTTDHFTGFTSARCIANKSSDKVQAHIEDFIAFLQKQSGQSVKIL